MSKDEIREKVATFLAIGDSDFDREGGVTPNWDYALEQADQILSLIYPLAVKEGKRQVVEWLLCYCNTLGHMGEACSHKRWQCSECIQALCREAGLE